jgi:hypothetical protein
MSTLTLGEAQDICSETRGIKLKGQGRQIVNHRQLATGDSRIFFATSGEIHI